MLEAAQSGDLAAHERQLNPIPVSGGELGLGGCGDHAQGPGKDVSPGPHRARPGWLTMAGRHHPPESPLQVHNRARLQGLRGVMKVSTTCDRRNWAGSAS